MALPLAVAGPLQWVGQGQVVEPVRGRHDLGHGDGADARIVKDQRIAAEQLAAVAGFDHPTRGGRMDAALGGDRSRGLLDVDGAMSLGLRLHLQPGGTLEGPTFSCSAALNEGQPARLSKGGPSTATGWRIAASCARGGSRIGPPSKHRRSGAQTMRSMIDRSRSCPAPPTMYQPNPDTQARS